MNPDLYGYFMEDNVNHVLLCTQIDKLVRKKIEELENESEHIAALEKDWKQIEEELQKEREHIEGMGDDEELAKERKYIEELEKIKKSFEEFKVREETHILRSELTPDGNTILHVAVQFGHVENVKVVLQACPDMVLQRNKKGETPLHMAAREGQADIVQALILGARKKLGPLVYLKVKEMLRATNEDRTARNRHLKEEEQWNQYVKVVLQECPDLAEWPNNGGETSAHMAATEGQADIVEARILTAQKKLGNLKVKEMLRVGNVAGDRALHMAARNCHLTKEKKDYYTVVKLLAEEDPEFEYPPNNIQETPLYLATERGNKGVAFAVTLTLLETCRSISYDGPGGRTALHAVALKDMIIGQFTIKEVLKRQKDLMNKADDHGWTPLHYAACSGNLPVMEEFFKYCPDCWEKVDNAGQNILHIAVEKNLKSVIENIVKQPWSRHLINQKNDDGNTPLHLLVASDYKVNELWKHPEADHDVFNDQGMTPIDLFWSKILETGKSNFADTMDYNFLSDPINEGGRIIASKDHDKIAILKRLTEKERKEEEERLNALEEKKSAKLLEVQKEEDRQKKKELQGYISIYQSLVIVAALTATITSAAAFVIPGGYAGTNDRDPGMAVLARAAAFKAFAVANTIALASSVSSIILCLTALYNYSINEGEKDIIHERYVLAGILILVAIFSLMLAFIAAAFAVLAHSIALSMSICLIVCVGLCFFFHELKTILWQLYWAAPARPATPEFQADTGDGDGMAQGFGV